MTKIKEHSAYNLHRGSEKRTPAAAAEIKATRDYLHGKGDGSMRPDMAEMQDANCKPCKPNG